MGNRTRHHKHSAIPGLIQKIQSDNHKSLISQPGDEKIAEMLQEILVPYQVDAKNFSDYRKLVTLAIVAWNIAHFPMDQMLSSLGLYLDGLTRITAQQREEFREIILDLIRRKIKLYPDAQRTILNFEITETQKSFQLAIASKPE